jgi:hypothetical protein
VFKILIINFIAAPRGIIFMHCCEKKIDKIMHKNIRDKIQTMTHKTLHMKLNIEGNELHLKPGLNSRAPEG